MALARRWKGRPRGLSELPVEIRNAPQYEVLGQDYWLDRADQSIDGNWYRLRFEGGLVHYWFLSAVNGQWTMTGQAPQFKSGESTAPVPDAHVVHVVPQPALPAADMYPEPINPETDE